MRRSLAIMLLSVTVFSGLAAPALAQTPATPGASPNTTSATPAASPVTDDCAGLADYFLAIAHLTEANEGFQTVRGNPTGAFDIANAEAEAVAASLDALIADLEAITPPPAAVAYHTAFTDLVAWYRDLATVPDFATFQVTVNRDKTLVPALSRATFAGMAACGTATWTAAYDAAFGDES